MDVACSSDPSQLTVLREACDKRTAAEIEIESLDPLQAWPRARLVCADDQAVYIDHPLQDGVPLELTAGEPTVVHFFFEGERYTFHSRVGRECRVPGDDQRLRGFSLAMPDLVQRHERRMDCRVSLAGSCEVVGEFQRAAGGGNHFQARLMNISAGGVAAIAFDLGERTLKMGEIYKLDFQLPGVKRTFSFRTELCHLRNGQGDYVVIGLKYVPESDAAEMRHAVRQVSQFVARELKKRSRSKAVN